MIKYSRRARSYELAMEVEILTKAKTKAEADAAAATAKAAEAETARLAGTIVTLFKTAFPEGSSEDCARQCKISLKYIEEAFKFT